MLKYFKVKLSRSCSFIECAKFDIYVTNSFRYNTGPHRRRDNSGLMWSFLTFKFKYIFNIAMLKEVFLSSDYV